MNGEFKNMWKKVTALSFKRMWEITKNLIITDSVLWRFCDVILHAERLSFGLFALSNVQLKRNISAAGSASVLR
jgi:hypothetical protein